MNGNGFLIDFMYDTYIVLYPRRKKSYPYTAVSQIITKSSTALPSCESSKTDGRNVNFSVLKIVRVVRVQVGMLERA